MATLEADKYQLFIPLMHHFWNMGDVILYNQIYGTNGITHTRSRNGTGSGNVMETKKNRSWMRISR